MVEAGVGGLDTPRTNIGDATYLSRGLDFDITQEPSFQSPSKDNNNLVQQLQNGRRGPIRTPRSRVALTDRRNLPAGLSGGEFTPLLKSATRNSALRSGKENVPQTPAFGILDNIPEDFSPLPQGSSVYGGSRNGSYMAGTPMPQIDSSSTASTPMALLPRRSDGPGVLQDGNQMSLREQENVIDKIEKENFGLKLKIHFLEEALRKAGPGFSEAALKENTELKVDKVTMQKELYRYRKTLTAAERELELYRQQLLEMQEKVKRKHLDAGQREELDRLHQALEAKEIEVNELKSQESHFEDLQDKIQDLEAELRQKERQLDDRDDEVENLKEEVENHVGTISDLEEAVKVAQRRAVELEEQVQAGEELEDARETIQELEQSLKRLKEEVDDAKEDCQEAMRDKERAEADLEELQDEMANKSITTKGLSRQIEEKANRLQDELEDLREKHGALDEQHSDKMREIKKLQEKIEDFKRDADVREQKLKDKFEGVQNERDTSVHEREALSKQLESTQKELQQTSDEKNLLQIRHDSLTTESASLQRELSRSRKAIEDLEDKLDHEKTLALNNEREVRDEYKGEIDRLNDEIEDLRAELREKDRLYDDDNDKWDNQRRNIESQRDIAEEKAAGLQRTIDRLQEAEGSLSSKETKLQQALQSEKERHESQEAALTQQISELNDDLAARQNTLDEVRFELAEIKEELRLSQREQKSLSEKVEGLEDEVEILQTSLDDESEQANKEIAATKQESETLRRQLLILKQDLAEAQATVASAHGQIEAFKSAVSHTGKGSQDQLGTKLRDAETQLAKVRSEKQSLQDQLAAVNIEVHSLRTSRASLEAERDEIRSQLQATKQQEEETFRLDQERMDLRTAKIKLDGEVRRLREEHKISAAQQQAVEKELQEEIDRASGEEARLNGEIHDLQKILRGSSEKRELAAAKKTVLLLEARIQELETQINRGQDQIDSTYELSIIRRDLNAARQKETEYLQREAAQKDILRGLKRQITELERKAHDAEVSRFISSSPHSSVSGSARKSELIEVRAQLATTHQALKDIRSQLKDAEKEAARKINATTLDIQARVATWESEKDQLERNLDEALSTKDELASKNVASEATITRLRGKIDRLEKALQAERINSGEDRTMALERRDLHEMLRETQLQAESLEIVVQERENTIAAITATEAELRSQLKRVREERSLHRSKATSAHEQLQNLERRYRKAKENWEAEKKSLTRGVRFVNTSLSVNDESEILALRKEAEEREHHHVKEMRGMTLMIEWLRAKCKREEDFRAVAAHGKKYMQLRIDLFEAWYVCFPAMNFPSANFCPCTVTRRISSY
jgi:chromosome segregation ATPase